LTGNPHTYRRPTRYESLPARSQIDSRWRNRILIGLLAISASALHATDFCPAYEESPIYRPRTRQVAADPSNWISKIQGAQSGDEILLADGNYELDQYAVEVGNDITIRGASGNRSAVLIQGQGYGVQSEGLRVWTAGVTIADLSITGIRDHAVSMKGEAGADATHIYNVHIYDIGTQHIKGTPSTRDGIIACSRIGYTPGGVKGDYINAVDIHGATDWIIRDNEIYNIWGDGTGCNVDVDCGHYWPGGGPSILLWNNASGNVVERNRIIDSFRGIAIGFDGDVYSGGAVRNNFIYQSTAQQNGVTGDAGMSIFGSSDVEIDHNTVLLGSSYPGAIEVQNSSNLKIRNNLLNKPIFNRGGWSGDGSQGNKTDGDSTDLVTPSEPHLNPDSDAVDFPTTVSVPGVPADIDGDSRPQGTRRDAGCDELGSNNAAIFSNGFESGDMSSWS
jgi:hypothetical protein